MKRIFLFACTVLLSMQLGLAQDALTNVPKEPVERLTFTLDMEKVSGDQRILSYQLNQMDEEIVAALEELRDNKPIFAPPYEYAKFDVLRDKQMLLVSFPVKTMTEEEFRSYMQGSIRWMINQPNQ